MEHRCSERYTADIKILIYKYDLPVAIGRIKNGNCHGFYIESDLADVKPLQQYGIEIMTVPSTQKLQRFKFDSMVIHTDKHGFGVELDALEIQESSLLVELLTAPSKAPQQEPKLFAMAANA